MNELEQRIADLEIVINDYTKGYMSILTVASFLDISESTARRWLKNDNIKKYYFHGNTRYKREDIENLAERKGV
ncbi:helix-turn-helix domain-containing protein [Lactobacillus sp. CC-MHH1034]|uniref:helix-turn-helix domain-containing protein n=1 Tax=Agrilactobacillus fermenti TaxID=2586909 RepID=UPI001E63C948|nr:helix-turn-helix domain-containing protein [Agrilactobacillus fermenti]MCD2257396.1 helix-turn-helix domain-containing protein [Agrilactobacillus fermenti]